MQIIFTTRINSGDQEGDAGRGCSNSTRGIFVGAGQTRKYKIVLFSFSI